MGLYLYLYQGPQSAPGPIEPPKGARRPKPKMFSFGSTINCLTSCPLTISPEIQWAYTYTYIGAPCGPPGPSEAPCGPLGPSGAPQSHPKAPGSPNLKCSILVLQESF